MQSITSEELKNLITQITPLDDQEAQLQKACTSWIESGEEMFRIKRPNIPPKHWIVYMPIIDVEKKKILLGDHVKSNLWLPPGGHVDPWEHPKQTALRELEEELFVKGDFLDEKPLMLSLAPVTTPMKEIISHEDVALWYLFKGDSEAEWKFDEREFRSLKWFPINQIPQEVDINMGRFIQKLNSKLKLI